MCGLRGHFKPAVVNRVHRESQPEQGARPAASNAERYRSPEPEGAEKWLHGWHCADVMPTGPDPSLPCRLHREPRRCHSLAR
jgi:hypothetical protein